MNVFIVDAGIALKWFLDESYSVEAMRAVEPENRLFAPDYLLVEFDNVLCKALRRQLIREEDAVDYRVSLRKLPVHLVQTADFLDLAWSLANERRHSLYDCLYLAVAMGFNGRVVTADRRFYDAFVGSPYEDHFLWIADVPEPA